MRPIEVDLSGAKALSGGMLWLETDGNANLVGDHNHDKEKAVTAMLNTTRAKVKMSREARTTTVKQEH